MSIQIRNLSKTFGQFAALRDVSLEVPQGDLLALLGPSGSGKTTLLRIIGGLEIPDAGRVLLRGRDITAEPPRERGIGFVFQQYALFRHMTVAENVGYALRVRHEADDAVRRRVAELLEMVQLESLGGRFPSELSGGQRQRVALARALAARPSVLLLDEPFGALDAKVRQELRASLRTLHEELEVTSIFVTHDQDEALELADHLVVMNGGRIEQTGSTDELYEHPASPFVFDFLGDSNVIPGEVRGHALYAAGAGRPVAHDTRQADGAVEIYVRPGDLRLADGETAGIDVRVDGVQRTGPVVRATAHTLLYASPLIVDLPHLHHDVPHFVAGAQVRLRMTQYSVYPAASVGGIRPVQPVLIGRERARGA